MSNTPFKKTVNTFFLTLYGTGTILGAGIFVVIGDVISTAGVLTPFAYLLAALVLSFTALSYAESAARVPSAGGPIEYSLQAFNSVYFSSLVGWALTMAQIVSASTIVTGFAQYLGLFVSWNSSNVIVAVVVVLTFVAIIGINQSTWFMAATTLLGLFTLMTAVYYCRDGFLEWPTKLHLWWLTSSSYSYKGFFTGAFLCVYSFVGFGDMASLAEEVKQPHKALPRAILIALVIVLCFYLLVSFSIVGSFSPRKFSGQQAPIVTAVELAGGAAVAVGIASLFIIINGSLTQIITGSRLLMDMGRGELMVSKKFSKVNSRTRTPVLATLFVAVLVLAFALTLPLQQLAEATSFVILLVFASVNFSLLKLKMKGQPQNVPNLWKAVPLIGGILCIVCICGKFML